MLQKYNNNQFLFLRGSVNFVLLKYFRYVMRYKLNVVILQHFR